jgi:NAD(P)H-flavin reductase
MTPLQVGDTVDIIGPLGNGYPQLSEEKIPVLVAGGYGTAALYLKAKELPVKGVEAHWVYYFPFSFLIAFVTALPASRFFKPEAVPPDLTIFKD